MHESDGQSLKKKHYGRKRRAGGWVLAAVTLALAALFMLSSRYATVYSGEARTVSILWGEVHFGDSVGKGKSGLWTHRLSVDGINWLAARSARAGGPPRSAKPIRGEWNVGLAAHYDALAGIGGSGSTLWVTTIVLWPFIAVCGIAAALLIRSGSKKPVGQSPR